MGTRFGGGTHRLAALLVVAGAGIAVALVGVAEAGIPDANGTIHGCADQASGALRVVDSSVGGCASGEQSLLWPSALGEHGAEAVPALNNLAAKQWVTLNSLKLVLGGPRDAWMDTSVILKTAASAKVNITLRVLVDGAPEEGALAEQTVSPGAYQTIAGLLKCNGMPAGAHTFAIQAQAARTGAAVVGGTWRVLGLPTS